jgi:putative transposase
MPNHWHLVLLPRKTGELSQFFRWVCTTHVRRWRMHRRNNGDGHLYQGRFKRFPIQRDEHLLKVLQYGEANPLRAEDWRYSSLWAGERPAESQVVLDQKILARPADWARRVNRSVAAEELERLHRSVNRGQPYGSDRWTQPAARRMGLKSTLRPPGRPPKITVKSKRRS